MDGTTDGTMDWYNGLINETMDDGTIVVPSIRPLFHDFHPLVLPLPHLYRPWFHPPSH